MAQLYISLGTSIKREKYLYCGLRSLEDVFGKLTLSSLYESESVGFKGPNFYNMVIMVSTDLSIQEVSVLLKNIELQHGRAVNATKYSPRTLDLDVLLFDDNILETPVQIPRHEITENAFVLWPLAELAGELIHPVMKKSYQQLWCEYDKQQQLTQIAFDWQKFSELANNEMDDK